MQDVRSTCHAGLAGHACQLNSQCLEGQVEKRAINVRLFIHASSSDPACRVFQLLKPCKILKNDKLVQFTSQI